MADLSDEKNGFRFKGVWWTEEEFSGVLEEVLSMHRTMSNHRIAFHFGVSEKAIRMLRARSSMADNVIQCAVRSARLIAGEPAQYSGRDWYGNPPANSEARKILAAAEAERERQWARGGWWRVPCRTSEGAKA